MIIAATAGIQSIQGVQVPDFADPSANSSDFGLSNVANGNDLSLGSLHGPDGDNYFLNMIDHIQSDRSALAAAAQGNVKDMSIDHMLELQRHVVRFNENVQLLSTTVKLVSKGVEALVHTQ